MSFFKNKFFIPVCILGLLGGYVAGNKFLPKQLTEQLQNSPSLTYDLMSVLGQQPTYYRQTASGNYLAGRFAQNNKDWSKAYDYINRVSKKEEGNIDLEKHAMVLAMASGDIKRATDLAEKTILKDENNLLSILFLSLKNFDQKNYQAVIDTLDSLEQETVTAFLVPVLKIWAQAGLGEVTTDDLPQSSFYAYHALLIHYAIKQNPKLLKYALQAYDLQNTDLRDIERYADLLALTDQKEKAKTLYQIIVSSGFSNETLEKKLTAVKEGNTLDGLINLPKIMTPKEGAARVFNDMANILLREQSDDSAAIFAQMSLFLDPNLESNHIIIASIYARHERYDDAISTLENIKPSSEKYIAAQRQIAEFYSEQEKEDEAIKILFGIYDKNKNLESLVQVGDIYRFQEDFEKSVEIYSQVLDEVVKTESEISEKYWHVLYARGMAYERLKKFKKSEDDLVTALKFKPEHPYLLNYLGYSWADQGIHLEKSLEMISRAVEAQPDDGYIADSLGWVFYKMNDFEAAIPHLERAVELLAYDATLNDHLGDAYWQVGRKNEARFQWQRAFNYSEDEEQELKTSIQEKLATGLEVITDKPLRVLSKNTQDDNGV